MRKKSLFRVDHAINILARSAARNAVKEQMCDQGVRVTLVPTREIDEKATIYLEEHPELFDQARERAVRTLAGYFYFPAEEFGFDIAAQIGAWRDRIKALPGWAHPYDLMPGHPLKL
jgi:hypothetical protein